MTALVNLELVFTAYDNLQAEMIIAALKNEGIPSFKQDLGNAGIMNIYGGNSKAGENIFVAKRHVEHAREVLVGIGLIGQID